MVDAKEANPTGRTQDRRKLVAILYADMVGYSRLIGLDDVGTLERLRSLRKNLIDPAIEEHGGRIVQTGGDSLLVVFDSVDGAVRCAIKMQEQVPVLDAEQPPVRAIRFRVGINLGDAIPDGTDLHGEAVNISARLQAECPPGGICVSRSVRDHVHGRLGLEFEELGALSLKNISRPVEAFVVRPDRAAPKSVERSLVQGTSLPLPDRPSIAVLAFDNMSGDPDQEYFSDGIAEDIITDLSRGRSLFVIARNSSFTYKGRVVDVKQIARELGVRYVVEGSVRQSGNRIRVTAQLIDAETGNHVWAERYDRGVVDVFAVQDEITTAVTTAIHPAVADAELSRILRKPPGNLGAWEAYQRALWHGAKVGPTDLEQERQFLERAIQLDPLFSSAHAMLAMTQIKARNLAIPFSPEATTIAELEAQRAIAVDPDEPSALAALAWVAFCRGDHESVVNHAERGIAVDPNYAGAYLAKAAGLVYSGRASEGREAGTIALRLNPRDPMGATARLVLLVAYYFERNYGEALAVCRSTIRDYPDFVVPYRWEAASLGQLNRNEEANRALQRAIALSAAAFDFYARNRQPWWRAEDHEHMLEGLRKAGWRR